jgi:hypothetical protein
MTRSRTPEDQSTQQRDPGPKALLCAMCHQALIDYFILRRMGAVRWCESTGHWRRRTGTHGSYVFQNMTPEDCRQLLRFICDDAERLLDLAGINMSPGQVRRRIIHLEKTGEWRRYFGQGCRMFRNAENPGT